MQMESTTENVCKREIIAFIFPSFFCLLEIYLQENLDFGCKLIELIWQNTIKMKKFTKVIKYILATLSLFCSLLCWSIYFLSVK